MTNCPSCNVSLIGDPIPAEHLEHYGGETHYGRQVLIEVPELYDGACAQSCPDCQFEWPVERSTWGAKLFIQYAEMKKKHGPKKGAVKKWSDRLQEIGNQSPPNEFIEIINKGKQNG